MAFYFQNLYYTFVTTWMDIGGIMLSEYVRERKTNTTYMWNLKPKQMNKPNQTHKYREQIGGDQRGRVL